jgi:hypothetical protein
MTHFYFQPRFGTMFALYPSQYDSYRYLTTTRACPYFNYRHFTICTFRMGWWLNGELRRMRDVVIVFYFKALLWSSLKEATKTVTPPQKIRWEEGANSEQIGVAVRFKTHIRKATNLLSMGTGGYFPGVIAAGVWSWPLISNYCRGQENMDL